MFSRVLDALFGCWHNRYSFPITVKKGRRSAVASVTGTYVVCLDCGKQFQYDLEHMELGKPIERSHTDCVVPADMPQPRGHKTKFALLTAVPAAFALGAFLKSRKPPKNGPDDQS